MEKGVENYHGHRIEIRVPEPAERGLAAPGLGEAHGRPELLIDDESVEYRQLPNGRYALRDYAYDWQDDLTELARRYIDYRSAGAGEAE